MTDVPGDLPEPGAPGRPGTVPSPRGAADTIAAEDVETDWRKLNVRMLLIHPVQEGVKFLPALAGVFILGRSRNGGGGAWWELAALAAVIMLGVLRYFTTRFRIENGQIELRKGLLNKQVIATPADRVRTVDVTAPIFHRLLGLAKVEIGTAGAGKERLVLDALTVKEARHLREELIHRRNVAAALSAPAPDAVVPGPGHGRRPVPASVLGSPTPPRGPSETTLLTFDPRWVRFAPLTMTGVLSALAIFGFGNQFLQRYLESSDLGGQLNTLRTHPVWVDVVVGVIALLIAVSVLAVLGYLLQFWAFRLTRHSGGTLHVTRGLLTTRETSIEEKRIRGVEVGEPLGLRLGGGGRLVAITTGLSKKEQERDSGWLVPPAPRTVVAAVAAAVVGDDEALNAPLQPHGTAARRRRSVRAIVPALLLGAAALGVAVLLDWPTWVWVLAFVPALCSPLLARDRYAGLGHHLTARHLVVRSGSFVRRRDLLLRSGIIGYNLRQTCFQRRAGVATLSATTAAGKQSYTAHDIPLDRGVALMQALDPRLVEQFLAR